MKALKTIKDDLKDDRNEIFISTKGDKFKVTVRIYYADLSI